MKTNKNIPLTHDERVKVNTIIHTASVATGAMGMVPIGPADTIMITPTQIGMIISLAIGCFYITAFGTSLIETF